MKYTPVGIDIAKHLMQLHFIDEYTGEVADKQIKRDALQRYGAEAIRLQFPCQV